MLEVALLLEGLVFLELGRRVGELEELVEGGGTKCSEPIFSLHSPAENGWVPVSFGIDCCACCVGTLLVVPGLTLVGGRRMEHRI